MHSCTEMHTHTHTAVKTDVSREKTLSVFYGCCRHLLEAVGSSTLMLSLCC